MNKKYIRWGYLFASLPFLMIFGFFVFGLVDDCMGLGFSCFLEVAVDDISQMFFMLFLGFIGIGLFLLFVESARAKPELAELKLKKMQVDSSALILVFEDPVVGEILYFVSEDQKDKYKEGKYYKVKKSKHKIYEILD